MWVVECMPSIHAETASYQTVGHEAENLVKSFVGGTDLPRPRGTLEIVSFKRFND